MALQGLGFRVWWGLMVEGLGCRAWSLGFRGFGFCLQGAYSG